MNAFQVGNQVDKVKGYAFPGTVVAVFTTKRGALRYVVELDELGILHIFNEEQLKPRIRVFQTGYREVRMKQSMQWDIDTTNHGTTGGY